MSTQSVPPAGGPRIAGMLNLALDQAIAYLDGEVAAQHPQLRAAHLQLFRTGTIEGLRVTELAARSGMTKQAMHELVRHLDRHGYVTREVDPDDERARRITLTAQGHELEQAIAAAATRLHLRWRETLGDELFAALWAGLARLTERPPEDDDPRRRAGRSSP